MVDHVPHVGPGHGPDPGQGPGRARYVHRPPAREADEVEVSPEARTIRWDKVRAVRRALENGTYLDPNKLDVALDRAIDDAFRPREPGEGQG